MLHGKNSIYHYGGYKMLCWQKYWYSNCLQVQLKIFSQKDKNMNYMWL